MTLCIQITIPHRGGLPHSDTWGSKLARSSPQIFAACHVLHRLLVPRHPPNALLILINSRQVSDASCQKTTRTQTPNNPGKAGSRQTPPKPRHAQEPSTPKTQAQPSPSHSKATHSAHTSTPLNTAKNQHMGPNTRNPQPKPPIPASSTPGQTTHASPSRTSRHSPQTTPPHNKETASPETNRDVLRVQKRTRT